MSWFDKLKETASNAGETAQRQARRVRLEVAAGQIERRIRGRKAAIGTAIYPRVKSGELTVDMPDVKVAMTAIAALEDELRANRAGLAALKEAGGAEAADDSADDGLAR